ncbi:MAG TPA: hypothetical protein PLX23_00580, partial [Candidatus Hydrogenedens sp.]|nr:hypothetical protein [Candidatus Hydrogenedens sp.]
GNRPSPAELFSKTPETINLVNTKMTVKPPTIYFLDLRYLPPRRQVRKDGKHNISHLISLMRKPNE